jgi:hypothetical protein
MSRTYEDEQRRQAILKAADDDLLALFDALVEVVKGRHYDLEGAQVEMEDVINRLREAVKED